MDVQEVNIGTMPSEMEGFSSDEVDNKDAIAGDNDNDLEQAALLRIAKMERKKGRKLTEQELTFVRNQARRKIERKSIVYKARQKNYYNLKDVMAKIRNCEAKGLSIENHLKKKEKLLAEKKEIREKEKELLAEQKLERRTETRNMQGHQHPEHLSRNQRRALKLQKNQTSGVSNSGDGTDNNRPQSSSSNERANSSKWDKNSVVRNSNSKRWNDRNVKQNNIGSSGSDMSYWSGHSNNRDGNIARRDNIESTAHGNREWGGFGNNRGSNSAILSTNSNGNRWNSTIVERDTRSVTDGNIERSSFNNDHGSNTIELIRNSNRWENNNCAGVSSFGYSEGRTNSATLSSNNIEPNSNSNRWNSTIIRQDIRSGTDSNRERSGTDSNTETSGFNNGRGNGTSSRYGDGDGRNTNSAGRYGYSDGRNSNISRWGSNTIGQHGNSYTLQGRNDEYNSNSYTLQGRNDDNSNRNRFGGRW